MTSKTTNKFSAEVRERAVRMVLDHEADHSSRWSTCQSISAKIGRSAHTLLDWVKQAEINAGKSAHHLVQCARPFEAKGANGEGGYHQKILDAHHQSWSEGAGGLGA